MKKIQIVYIPNSSRADYAVYSLPMHILSGIYNPVEGCLSVCKHETTEKLLDRFSWYLILQNFKKNYTAISILILLRQF